MERLRILLALSILPALLLVATGCGEEDPDPTTVLDRALTRGNLSQFAIGTGGGGAVAVQALGYEDRVLNERLVKADPPVVAEIKEALGSSSGLRALVEELEFVGTEELGGTEVDHVSGELAPERLAEAFASVGADDVASLADPSNSAGLDEALAGADFDLYAGRSDGVIRRLDLTLALDDPENALPPTRIRFSLTPE